MNPPTTQPDPYAAIMKKYNYAPPASSGQAVSSADDFDNFMSKQGAYAPQPDTAANSQKDGQGATFSAVGGAIGNDFNTRADNVGKIQQSTDNPVSKVLQVGGQGAGVVNDTIGEVIKSAIKPEVLQSFGEHLAPLVQSAAGTSAGKAIINWWGGLDPETQRNLSAGGQIASLLSNAVGAGAAKEGAVVGTEAAMGAAKDAVAPAVDAAKGAVQPIKDMAAETLPKVKQAIKPTLAPEDAVGQIIQGKPEDVAAAHRVLQSPDFAGAKTYAQATKIANTQIKPLAEQVDTALAKDTTARPLASFERTVGEGPNATKVNYVDQAIQHLKEFYEKAGDANGLTKIKDLEDKAAGVPLTPEETNTAKAVHLTDPTYVAPTRGTAVGLTNKEVNDLSRTYNTEFGSKAFSKQTGDPLTSVNAQKFENTRMGLKDTARAGLGGDEAKALDAKLSDLYDTRTLLTKMANKVNAQVQQTTPQSILPKIVGGVVKTADMLTGNPLKAIGREIGTVGSDGKMSAQELEKALPKNLKIIQSAVQSTKADAATIGSKAVVGGSKMRPPATGGYVKIGSGDLKTIHPEDLGTMKDFTDYVGGDYKPTAAEALKLETDATRLWEHYFPTRALPKNLQGIANRFGRVLEQKGYK